MFPPFLMGACEGWSIPSCVLVLVSHTSNKYLTSTTISSTSLLLVVDISKTPAPFNLGSYPMTCAVLASFSLASSDLLFYHCWFLLLGAWRVPGVDTLLIPRTWLVDVWLVISSNVLKYDLFEVNPQQLPGWLAIVEHFYILCFSDLVTYLKKRTKEKLCIDRDKLTCVDRCFWALLHRLLDLKFFSLFL